MRSNVRRAETVGIRWAKGDPDPGELSRQTDSNVDFEALLREETVDAEELNRVLGPRPQLAPGQDGNPKVAGQG